MTGYTHRLAIIIAAVMNGHGNRTRRLLGKGIAVTDRLPSSGSCHLFNKIPIRRKAMAVNVVALAPILSSAVDLFIPADMSQDLGALCQCVTLNFSCKELLAQSNYRVAWQGVNPSF